MLHVKLIIVVQLNGLIKQEYLSNGNLLVLYCGYMENVCYS